MFCMMLSNSKHKITRGAFQKQNVISWGLDEMRPLFVCFLSRASGTHAGKSVDELAILFQAAITCVSTHSATSCGLT